MCDVIEFVKHNFDEAEFFLKQMYALEDGIDLPKDGYSKKQQYAFLYSAFLNACYCMVQKLWNERTKAVRPVVDTFKQNYAEFYAQASKGGRRANSVYFEPPVPGFDGWKEPASDTELNLRLRPWKEPKSDNELNLEFHSEFWENEDSQKPISLLCSGHLKELQKLINDCEKIYREVE